MTAEALAQQYVAEVPHGRVDDGLFGPGSASWQVWSHPAMLVGITRSFILEMVGSTQGAAALEEHSFYRQDPLGRLRRTIHYFYSQVYGDSAEVAAANRRLDRLHQRIIGNDPMNGAAYSALDPYLRLGTHVTTWHSVYYAYEKLGGRTSPTLEADYFAESLVAGQALGLDIDAVRAAALRHGVAPDAMPDDPPATRDDYRQLWAAGRHLVCVNAQTRGSLDAILRPSPPDRRPWTLAKFAAYPGLSRMAIALIPRDIRHTVGLPLSPTGDRIALLAGQAAITTLAHTPLGDALFADLCPQAHELRLRAIGRL